MCSKKSVSNDKIQYQENMSLCVNNNPSWKQTFLFPFFERFLSQHTHTLTLSLSQTHTLSYTVVYTHTHTMLADTLFCPFVESLLLEFQSIYRGEERRRRKGPSLEKDDELRKRENDV